MGRGLRLSPFWPAEANMNMVEKIKELKEKEMGRLRQIIRDQTVVVKQQDEEIKRLYNSEQKYKYIKDKLMSISKILEFTETHRRKDPMG